ncbi:MAG TPA: helix-turn-helix domain-containing protein [Candidatus Olsenella avistercoris]|nr:helix-turn-helix domain-containing protein [Candidatus Olsenella avistercoris]
MDPHVNIGRTIARERRAAHVTQGALADHLGVSKAAVSKWELGLSVPDVALLPRIAAYFSLTIDELFDWRARLSEGGPRRSLPGCARRGARTSRRRGST